MSNQLTKLARSATAVALTVLLALSLAPAAAMNYHWEGWHLDEGCLWYGYHNYDETGRGHVYGRTVGGDACRQVYVRVNFDGSFVHDWDYTRAEASSHTWSPDFENSYHRAYLLGPTRVSFTLW